MPVIGAKNHPRKNHSHALRSVVCAQYAQKIPNKKNAAPTFVDSNTWNISRKNAALAVVGSLTCIISHPHLLLPGLVAEAIMAQFRSAVTLSRDAQPLRPSPG